MDYASPSILALCRSATPAPALQSALVQAALSELGLSSRRCPRGPPRWWIRRTDAWRCDRCGCWSRGVSLCCAPCDYDLCHRCSAAPAAAAAAAPVQQKAPPATEARAASPPRASKLPLKTGHEVTEQLLDAVKQDDVLGVERLLLTGTG